MKNLFRYSYDFRVSQTQYSVKNEVLRYPQTQYLVEDEILTYPQTQYNIHYRTDARDLSKDSR